MLRTALRPASLGLLALLLAAASACALLGHWQLDRSREHARVSPTETVVPLATVLAPASPFTGNADHQRVAVTGTWEAGSTRVVADRPQGGRPGSLVVTGLRVPATGGLLPVVRGWLPQGEPLPAEPSGDADLAGRLQLSEAPRGLGADGALRAVSSADLVNTWAGPLYTGYLLADGAGAPLVAVPSPAPRPALDLQNLSYAFQWWLFAAFALVLWVKTVRDRRSDELADAGCEDGGQDAEQQPEPRQEART